MSIRSSFTAAAIGLIALSVGLSACGESASTPTDTVAHYDRDTQANFLASCMATGAQTAASQGQIVDSGTKAGIKKGCKSVLLCLEKRIDIGSFAAAEQDITAGRTPDPATAKAIRSCYTDAVLEAAE